MISLSSNDLAVSFKQFGKLFLSHTREWYLVAVRGFATPLNKAPASCSMRLVFPCISRRAGTMDPPNAYAIPWCPRQTPKVGILGPSFLMMFRHTPKYRLLSGLPGPGEIMI